MKSENGHCIKSVNESGELEGALVGEMPKVEHIRTESMMRYALQKKSA